MTEIKFKGRFLRELYRSDNYAIMAFDVNKQKYPDLRYNDFQNIVVSGEFPKLEDGVEYDLNVTEVMSKKYGMTYKLLSLMRETPKTKMDILNFLSQILTVNQAHALYNAYPDIIDKIKNDDLADIDFSKMKGITNKNFSKLVAKIQSNMFAMELISIFNGAVSLTNIYKLLEKYHSVEAVKEQLSQSPYKCLCGLSGIGFKKADAILLALQNMAEPPIDFIDELKSSREMCKACILYSLMDNELNGNTKIHEKALKEVVSNMTPEAINYFEDIIQNDKEIYYDDDTLYVALFRTYNKEKDIVNIIFNAVYSEQTSLHIKGEVEDYTEVDGMTLTDKQAQAIANLVHNKFSIINGVAGAGKTYTTKAIVNMLRDNNISCILCSPTGKASKILESYTHHSASTIHRALGYNPMMPNPWTFNRDNPLRHKVIIIDEFSMVDIDLFWHLLDAVDFSYSRLLLIGDNAQLPSVSCGNLLHDFLRINTLCNFKTTLDKVFRYQEGGLMTVATDIRMGKAYLGKQHRDKVSIFGENKDYCYLDVDQDDLVLNIVKLYRKLLEQGNEVSDIQVLTPKNVGKYGTKVLNNALQKIANPNCGTEPVIEIGDVKYYEGDIVLQTKNNYEAPSPVGFEFRLSDDGWTAHTDWTEDDAIKEFIANGETGVIKKIFSIRGKAKLLIDFDGIEVIYSKGDLMDVSLGYAMTIHKSQGSSSKIVIVSSTKSDIFMLNSNLLYVGLTRAKERCYHIGQTNTINNAVHKKANRERNTWTVELFELLEIENS